MSTFRIIVTDPVLQCCAAVLLGAFIGLWDEPAPAPDWRMLMDFLLSFIPGGGITALVAGAVAALGIFWRLLANAKKSGVDQQKAKEAEARAKNLQDVKRAQDAAGAVRPDDGGMSVDPLNRDNRR